MSEDDLSEQKNISGLSFRDLREEESEGQTQDFVFIDEEIGGENRWKRFVKWFKSSFSTDTDKKGLLSFFSNFFTYIFSRLRVIFVLMSVLADIFFSFFEKTKDSLVKKSFWGRGGFLFYTAQVVVIVVVVVVIVASIYRNPAITNANEENLDYISVPEDDLMTMNASLNTLIPQDRGRLYSEKYIVKVGDTISTIASYYGLGKDTILWANDLDDDDYIKPGQELVIPPGDGVLVTIKSGDTMESLAKKYSSEVATIAEWNWIEKDNTLVVGDEIFIPNGKEPTPVVVATKISYSYTSSSVKYTETPVDPNVGKFLIWPVAGSSRVTPGRTFRPAIAHYGIDIFPTSGQPNVIAAASGTIISAGWGGSSGAYRDFGYYVHIDHGNGYTTLYAHMAKLYVTTGYVSSGQALGLIGETGFARGVHVHFELRKGLSGRINPIPYMQTVNW